MSDNIGDKAKWGQEVMIRRLWSAAYMGELD